MVRSRDSARPKELEGGRDSEHKEARKIRAKGKLGLPKVRLILTPSLRRTLKRPVGRVYSVKGVRSASFQQMLRLSPLVVTVGDRVTETMQELGRTPDVQVIDQVERRTRREAPDVPYARLFTAANPAGSITFEAIRAIEEAFAGEKPARVIIDGEEDLLALPAIESAPPGSTLYYGQPGVGVVMVEVDARAKRSVERLMMRMKRESS